MLTNDQAVCIRAVDYSETSQIVTFFARNTGKLSLIAKGAKRNKNPFGGPIDIFSYGNIVFSDAGRDKLAPLTEFEPIEGSANSSVLAQDLYILHCCLFAVELINLLTKEYDAHPGLFDCLITFLRDVSRQKVKVSDGCRGEVLTLLISFQLRLLKEIGLSPVFDFCVNCSRAFNVHWNSAYFSVNAKGLICGDCWGTFPDKIQIKLQTVKVLADVKSIDSADYRIKTQAEDLLINYIADILGRHPRMAKYILK